VLPIFIRETTQYFKVAHTPNFRMVVDIMADVMPIDAPLGFDF